jgi:hypothetical protein
MHVFSSPVSLPRILSSFVVLHKSKNFILKSPNSKAVCNLSAHLEIFVRGRCYFGASGEKIATDQQEDRRSAAHSLALSTSEVPNFDIISNVLISALDDRQVVVSWRAVL